MKNRSSINNLFGYDRKILYIILSIVMVLVLTLTVVYAALSTTLNINGNAEVSAASWDIYLDNVQLSNQSATTNVPTITDKTTASFSTTLTKPGDFYEFSIDVVNDGSIDAMIDSIAKTPELTPVQAKYLNYIVEYQNGDSINTKQLVAKNSFVRLKVKVEFRKDISSSDLPTQSETLNFSFTIKYVQSDENGTSVRDDGVKKAYRVVSGDLDTLGSEICIEEECFNVLTSDETSVTMFAKYNLYVGGKYENSTWTPYGEEATGIQDSTMKGWVTGESERNGVVAFSSRAYWCDSSEIECVKIGGTVDYIYNSNSNIYNYVENYKTYLEGLGATIEEARLINFQELYDILGFDPNHGASKGPDWSCNTSYWAGSGVYNTSGEVWCIDDGFMHVNYSTKNHAYGVRPVIIMSKN